MLSTRPKGQRGIRLSTSLKQHRLWLSIWVEILGERLQDWVELKKFRLRLWWEEFDLSSLLEAIVYAAFIIGTLILVVHLVDMHRRYDVLKMALVEEVKQRNIAERAIIRCMDGAVLGSTSTEVLMCPKVIVVPIKIIEGI